MKKLYFILAVTGFLMPYYFLLNFVLANGLNLRMMINQLFANDISTFFAADLVISALVLWLYLYREAARYQMGNSWISVVATLLIGPSFAFPMFVYIRESRMAAQIPEAHRSATNS